jgi:hypothetical protein
VAPIGLPGHAAMSLGIQPRANRTDDEGVANTRERPRGERDQRIHILYIIEEVRLRRLFREHVAAERRGKVEKRPHLVGAGARKSF